MRRLMMVTIKLILKVIQRTLKKIGDSNRCIKCSSVGVGSKKHFDRNKVIG